MATPNGLQNNGSNCYLNSMIQCLLSCKTFNNFVFNLPPNVFTTEYKQIYNSGGDCRRILQFIIDSTNGSTNTLHYGMQEDSNEGFILLIDAISKLSVDVNKLFDIRYISKYICICGNSHTNNDEKCDIFISYDNSTVPFQDYIKNQKTILQDYTCPSCNKRGTTTQVKMLCRISDIVAVVMKKYTKKEHISLPSMFQIKTFSGMNDYKLVAAVDHFGSMSGGHYIAKAYRGNKSYIFNDSIINPQPLEITQNTYLAFYTTT